MEVCPNCLCMLTVEDDEQGNLLYECPRCGFEEELPNTSEIL